MTIADLSVILPELILVVYAMAGLMIGVYVKGGKADSFVYHLGVALLGVVAVVMMYRRETSPAFENMYLDDTFARYLKVLIALAAAGVLLSSVHYLKRISLFKFEFPVLISLSVVGMMIMVSATNLLSLYIGLELQSLALYVLAAFRRDNLRSSEAGMKYFVLGALSSGLFLFGASLIYGFTGGLGYDDIANVIGNEPSIGVVFGLAFLAAAFAFKISAAPFHMWTPDVYQGAPTAVTALFATAPKVAALGMMARVFYQGFSGASEAWQQILVPLALVSVFVGAIAAIGQKNIKRLLAFSSVLNMGFVLLALLGNSADGIEAALFFMTVYVAMSLAGFAFIMSMEREGREVVDIADLSLLSTKSPLIAAGFAIIMLSMAGIPPLAGFFGKFLAFTSAVNAGYSWLAIAAAIASVIGAFYYLRLVYLMYFGDAPSQDHEQVWTIGQIVVFVVGVLLMLIWSVKFFVIGEAGFRAAQSLLS